MKYYIISEEIAKKIGCTKYRIGGADGYVVSPGDLAVYGIDNAIAAGALEVTEKEAKDFINIIIKQNEQ